MAYVDDDGLGWDLYEVPEPVYPLKDDHVDVFLPPKSDEGFEGKALTDPSSKFDLDEDSRIKALVNTSALDWQQSSSSCGFGSGHGMRGGRMTGGRGFGRGGGLQWKTPPEGYICHRCKVAGHFIQDCPTNGDSNYDFKRMKPPTGIPKSMLMANSDGLYALPSGEVAVLRPDESAFGREIEGLPSTSSHVGDDVPQELYCQLCKQIMKFAVLSSKCCFQSFCDECIRNFIISKAICVCGATNILADDLLPNLTLRKTINQLMESNDGSAENDGSALQVEDIGSNNLQSNVPSPMQYVNASKGIRHESVGIKEPAPQESRNRADKEEVAESGMASNAGLTHGPVGVKEPAAQARSESLADKECEAAKKKKREKAHMPLYAAEMQWHAAQNNSAENYMMPMAFAAYNPYWTAGIQPGMEGFFTPYAGAFPHIGFGVSSSGMPFGGMLPQHQFAGFAGPPSINRSIEKFEVGKSPLKKKYEVHTRESLKGQELDQEVSSSRDIPPMKSKSIIPPRSTSHHSKRPYADRQEHDYDYKRPRRHGHEHRHYQDDRHHQHNKEHHCRSRHHRSVQTYH